MSDRIRAMGAPHWLALFGLILGAWAVLYIMAVPWDLRVAARVYGTEFWQTYCTLTPDAAGFARIVSMWALMSAAMMLPTALPALATYDDLSHAGAEARPGVLAAGYIAVWLGFSVLAAGLQFVLTQAGVIDPLGQSTVRAFSGALLLVAGLYQMSPMKAACLDKCRQPLTFFMSHWDAGPWRNGLRLGLVCLGCCWALMLLAFVGGMMNLVFMGLATLVMVLEKLPQVGRYVTLPLGVGLCVAAPLVGLGLI